MTSGKQKPRASHLSGPSGLAKGPGRIFSNLHLRAAVNTGTCALSGVAPGGVCLHGPCPAFLIPHGIASGTSGPDHPVEEHAIPPPNPSNKPAEPRINERIRIPQVRVVGDDGEQIGIMVTRDALVLAQSKGLDLVEVAPTARPPVCKIMDYGKYKYETNRAAKAAKKKQHQMQLKEVKMRPKIEDHDYDFKLKHARTFLAERDKVKFTVTFRGREMAHQELGYRIIDSILKDLADVAQVESPARSEGRTISMVLSPKPQVQAKKPEDSKPSVEGEASATH